MARRKLIRRRVREILSDLKTDTPPIDVTQVAKSLGAVIHRVADSVEDVSGFLLRDGVGEQAIIGVNGSEHPVRRRFTIAHELGHLCLHQDEALHVDAEKRYHLIRRSPLSSRGDNPKEIEANIFAAELLMPAHMIATDMDDEAFRDLPDRLLLKQLARRYEVSQMAMNFRMANLGYIEL